MNDIKMSEKAYLEFFEPHTGCPSGHRGKTGEPSGEISKKEKTLELIGKLRSLKDKWVVGNNGDKMILVDENTVDDLIDHLQQVQAML